MSVPEPPVETPRDVFLTLLGAFEGMLKCSTQRSDDTALLRGILSQKIAAEVRGWLISYTAAEKKENEDD